MTALEHGGRLDAAIAAHGGTVKQWLAPFSARAFA